MNNTKQTKTKPYIDINYYLHSKENSKKILFYNQKCNKCGFMLLNNAYKCDRCGSYDVIDKE